MELRYDELLPVQQWLLDRVRERKRLTFLPGDIRAGKTSGAAMALYLHSLMRTGSDYIIAGKTVKSVIANVEPYFRQIAKDNGTFYRLYRGSDAHSIIGDNRFSYFGAAHQNSGDVIRGRTAPGGMIDEITLTHPNFYSEMLGRCSIPDAMIILTTNPGGRTHWVKKQILDRADEIGAAVFQATLEDNKHIPEHVKEEFDRELHGHYKKRMLQGLWASPEGLVYPEEIISRTDDGGTGYYVWGVDYGQSGVTAAVCLRGSGYKWTVVAEYYRDGQIEGVAPDDIVLHYIEEAFKGMRPKRVAIDPSAASLKAAFRRNGYSVNVATEKQGRLNAVNAGIQATYQALANKYLLLHRRCELLYDEMLGYSWREPTDAGIEAPVKRDDHLCDALRYIVRLVMPNSRIKVVGGGAPI